MTKQQIKLLKQIQKNPGYIKPKDYLILDYLIELKYVDAFYEEWFDKGKPSSPPICSITEHGKNFLSSHKQNCFRYWLPIILSNVMALAALALSIFNYLSSN